jgi:hypothetical protein
MLFTALAALLTPGFRQFRPEQLQPAVSLGLSPGLGHKATPQLSSASVPSLARICSGGRKPITTACCSAPNEEPASISWRRHRAITVMKQKWQWRSIRSLALRAINYYRTPCHRDASRSIWRQCRTLRAVGSAARANGSSGIGMCPRYVQRVGPPLPTTEHGSMILLHNPEHPLSCLAHTTCSSLSSQAL